MPRSDNQRGAPVGVTTAGGSAHGGYQYIFRQTARGIVNRLIREPGPINDQAPAFPLGVQALGALRQRAQGRGILQRCGAGKMPVAARKFPRRS